MSGVKVEQLTQPLVLGEGPHWDTSRQCLYFVDILGRTLHKYTPADNKHTSTRVEGRVGFIIPVEGAVDEFVVGVEREVWVVEWDGGQDSAVKRKLLLATVDEHDNSTRLNDAKADPRGRLFAGTMGEEDPPGLFAAGAGSLYRLDAGGGCRPVLRGLGISNGLAWDLANSTFYYIDSLEFAVSKFHYDADTGDISDKSVLFDMKAHGVAGFPDGQTLDAAGNLWVANFDGSQVLHIDTSTGELLRAVPVPAKQVTSVAFGGARLDELYVTTASMNIGGAQPPPAGALFRLTGLGVTGLPMSSVRLN